MTRLLIPVLIMTASTLIASFSQILLKAGADREHSSRLGMYLNRFVASGYGLLLIAMLLTILAYRFADSYMSIPLLESMGYVFVMVLGRVFFKERITRNKIAGLVLIFAGIALFYL